MVQNFDDIVELEFKEGPLNDLCKAALEGLNNDLGTRWIFAGRKSKCVGIKFQFLIDCPDLEGPVLMAIGPVSKTFKEEEYDPYEHNELVSTLKAFQKVAGPEVFKELIQKSKLSPKTVDTLLGKEVLCQK